MAVTAAQHPAPFTALPDATAMPPNAHEGLNSMNATGYRGRCPPERQTEGQICKLKLVKRQMNGRGNIDLLQARVIGPA